MKIRIRKRHDNPVVRRRFAILNGHGVGQWGRADITRIFFPWFFVDLIFPSAMDRANHFDDNF